MYVFFVSPRVSFNLSYPFHIFVFFTFQIDCCRTFDFKVRHKSKRIKNRVLTAAISGGKWKEAQPNFTAEERASIATYWQPSRTLPPRGKSCGGESLSSDDSPSHLDESVTKPIQYSTFAKPSPSSEF